MPKTLVRHDAQMSFYLPTEMKLEIMAFSILWGQGKEGKGNRSVATRTMVREYIRSAKENWNDEERAVYDNILANVVRTHQLQQPINLSRESDHDTG